MRVIELDRAPEFIFVLLVGHMRVALLREPLLLGGTRFCSDCLILGAML